MIGKGTACIICLMVLCATGWSAAGMSADNPDKYYDSVIPEKLLYIPVLFATGKPDSVRLTLFWKISPAAVQFVRNDSLFEGRYEFTVELRSLKNDLVFREIRRNSIAIRDFRDSEDAAFLDQEPLEAAVQPGSYRFFFEFFDLETRKPVSINRELIIPDFYKPGLSCSRILFTQSPVATGKIASGPPAPVYPPVVSTEDSSTTACFVLNSTNPGEPVRLKVVLLDQSRNVLFEDSILTVQNAPAVLHAFQIQGRLRFGHYRLRIEANQGTLLCSSEESIYVRWGNLPADLPDIQSAVESLVYIMPRDGFAQIRSLTQEGQKKALEEFWKQHDPEPKTARNELEEEFYRRVVFANQHYSQSSGQLGWKTDRGRIVILFGQPADVERRESALNRNTRYEIWSYPHLRRSFVFEDRFGSGDFRLLSEETR